MGLKKALYDAARPESDQYGRYLTKEQVRRSLCPAIVAASTLTAQAEQYAAPSDAALAAITTWLSSNGLTSTSLTPSGDWISV